MAHPSGRISEYGDRDRAGPCLAAGESKQRLREPRGRTAGTYAVKIAFKPAA